MICVKGGVRDVIEHCTGVAKETRNTNEQSLMKQHYVILLSSEAESCNLQDLPCDVSNRCKLTSVPPDHITFHTSLDGLQSSTLQQ